MFSIWTKPNDRIWCWATRKLRKVIRLKSASTRLVIFSFLLTLILFCITFILAVLALEGGTMMGWIWGALALSVISLVVFLSFWGWVTRNKSDEDTEREETQDLLLSIKTELGEKLDKLIELMEQNK